MGCDCHPSIEILGDDGTWVLFRHITYHESDPVLSILGDRNYRRFGLLAGVRDKSYEPLFPRRGIPKDSCPEIVQAFQADWYHSITWFTVQELLDVDWDATVGIETIELDPSSYVKWVEGGRKGVPDELVADSIDTLVTEEEMVLLVMSGVRTRRRVRAAPGRVSRLKPLPYVRVQTHVTLRDMHHQFVDEVIPALVKLGEPSKVRVVMAFDS